MGTTVTVAILIGIPVLCGLLLVPATRTRRVAAGRAHHLPGRMALARPRVSRPARAEAAPSRASAREPRGAVAALASVSVVIPTLNEEGSLPWVLDNLPVWVDEVVLVDGLSTDATQVLARRIRPDAVVVHQFRRGKGAALRAGFAAASCDIVVMIDADGSTDPREMGRFVEALRDGADFVKGTRHGDGGGSADFTPLRSLGNRALVVLANLLYGSRFTDLCYGYCAFWRRDLGVLDLTADGFEIETQLVLAALRAELEIREVPSFELARRAGTSNLNALRDGLRVLRTMLGGDERREPGRIHFTLRAVHLPVWRSDHLPAGVERRRFDTRVHDRESSGYAGDERRMAERRETVGTVVAYRAVYGPPAAPGPAGGQAPLPAAPAPPARVAGSLGDRAPARTTGR